MWNPYIFRFVIRKSTFFSIATSKNSNLVTIATTFNIYIDSTDKENSSKSIYIFIICQMLIVRAHWSIPSYMTICNQAYFLPKIIFTIQYYSILFSVMVTSYCTIVTSYCTIVWQKCHSGATMISDITIWHHNSSTMTQTVEQGMLVNYYGQSSNICTHRPMCLNNKHLTYNKANIDLWCWAIWVLWIFGNNIDRGEFHIALITGPYLYNIYLLLPGLRDLIFLLISQRNSWDTGSICCNKNVHNTWSSLKEYQLIIIIKCTYHLTSSHECATGDGNSIHSRELHAT